MIIPTYIPPLIASVQALGSILGPIVVLLIARRAFSTYRRQKIEDHRLEAARGFLKHFYAARGALSKCRNPLANGAEVAASKAALPGNMVNNNHAVSAQTFITRYLAEQDAWDNLHKLSNDCYISFGEEEQKIVDEFRDLVQTLVVHMDMERSGHSVYAKNTMDFALDCYESKKDNVVGKVVDISRRFEAVMFPVIRP
jgi:hypothetical protein